MSDRCIECEEIQLARVADAAPVQSLPVPAAALAGFPDGRGIGSFSRRRLLQLGLAGMASVYGPRALGFEEVWEEVANAQGGPPPPCLVVVYLAGGNDGLSTLVPHATADWTYYQQQRASLHRAIGPTVPGRMGSMPLTGAAAGTLGWANIGVSTGGGGDNGHATHGFDALYGPGTGGAGSDLAVMPAVDYTPPNLSHFASSDYWFNGTLAPSTTGWLGRWIDRNGSATNPLQAVSIDSALSKTIRTADKPVSALPGLVGLGFSLNPGGGSYGTPSYGGTSSTTAQTSGQVDQLSGVATPPGNEALRRSRLAYELTSDVWAAGSSLSGAALGGGYPAGRLSDRLKLAALLLGANLGTRIITVHWGSFDTHGNQLQSQDPQLSELSRALTAFRADLAARSVEQNVTTLVFSEFGRRVAENGGGTDHGAGGLMMLMGSAVRGGWASEFPGCASSAGLDAHGNLKVATDFRSVYQALIDEWLGDDPAAILGGTFADIARPDGQTGLIG
jgi:uncharacterized protein (DUF1501 family)